MNEVYIVDMARIYIKSNFIDKQLLPSNDDILNSVKIICINFNASFDEFTLKKITDELSVVFSVEIEGGSPVISNNEDHIDWLSQERGNISWDFWTRYEKYLAESKKMPEKSISAIDKTTDKILALLEKPSRPGEWDRRGLVIGSVQSGKTGNYTGLICKAADSGYNVIVVLAGVHNDLRAQTQQRLDEGFLGYETSVNDGLNRKKIGVGLINPAPKANTITNKSENGDFQRQSASQFHIQPEQIPLLFVVKKNKSILENLNSWVSTFAEQNSGKVKGTSLLVIDDEADQASVDTNDEDPSTINKLIRRLLNSFEKSAYVGYTATPFANILISNYRDHVELGEDLFPKSFIISLPIPSNYIGPQKIFSASADEDYPIIKSLTDDIDDSSEWIPAKHRRDLIPTYHGAEVIPPCLEKAINSFVLSIAIRDFRKDVKKHNSMLIHVTRFTEVQEKVEEQVSDYVDSIKRKFKFEDKKTGSFVTDLRKLWEEDYAPTSKIILGETDHQWTDVVNMLPGVFDRLEVKIINGSSNDGLEYLREEYPECVIAIGGDKLSRGLTLEGLSVSYFLRQSRMYDTLMQMGRWFGYRPRYEDLCRLYTNSSLVGDFQSVLLASEELTEELNQMSSLGMTPSEFGLKVKVSPGLLVTSKLKMRDTLELDISFASGVAESTSLSSNQIDKNWKTLNNFISRLGTTNFQNKKEINTSKLNKGWKDIFMYQDVKGLEIANLMMELKTHESSRAVIPEVIAQYINAQIAQDELTKWTVVVHSGTGQEVEFSNSQKINKSRRKVLSIDSDKITFRRLASKNDEFVDLSNLEIESFIEKSQREDVSFSLKDVHSRIVRNKKNGLIMFYIIEPLDENQNEIPLSAPLVGFMVSFPRSEKAKTITYRVNSVWIDGNL